MRLFFIKYEILIKKITPHEKRHLLYNKNSDKLVIKANKDIKFSDKKLYIFRRTTMKKLIRRTLAIALSLSMVFTGFMFSPAKVSADTLTQDEIDSIAGNGTMTNLALNVDATVYPGVAEGNKANLTNGNFSGHCALSSGWGYSGEAYAIIDLGNYYKAESLDEIILAYKDMATNDTVAGRTYNIQYSVDQSAWTTVYTSGTVAAEDLAPDKCTIDDVSVYQDTVRFVKIDYPSLPTYGIQLTEIAVLAADPELAPMDTCDDPAGVSAESVGLGQITFNITAGEDQEDYTYAAMLDGPSGTILNANCAAGVDYTYEVPGGNHRIFVQSHKGTAISDGIYSSQVTVNTYETEVADSDWNYAYGRSVTLSSGASTEPAGAPATRVTDGTISGGNDNYITSDKGQAGSWFTIDLQSVWKASSFETICVWFRSNVGGTFPENGGMKFQYSTDGEDFVDVATLTQAEFTAQKGTQQNPFRIMGDVSGLTEGVVRFVRVYFPNSVAYGAQITEIGVYDIDGDAEEAEVETVTDPADFTAAATDYNEISGVITPDVDQEDYTYSIFLNGQLKAEGLTGGAYTLSGVAEGTYDVTVKSYKDGFFSHGLTVSGVTVEDGFTYTHTTGSGVYDDTSEYGFNLVTKDGATRDGVSATASAGNATSAIDYKAGTRWETPGSDPQWITVDLGAVKTVKAFEAWWETASSKDFTIDVSTDGQTFKTVATVTGAASGNNRRDTIVLKEAANARYVRLYATARTTGYGHSIWEIAIYDGQVVPDNYMDVTDYKAQGTYPTETGKIFAGWFEDADFTTPYMENTGSAYAKFIDEDVLTTKFQIATDDTAVRFLSSVDGMDYEEVGFIFTGTYGNAVITEKTKTTNKLYSKITADGQSTEPDVFSPDSQYFFTYTVRGMEDATTNSTWHVTPFYKTLDGTVVTGTPGELPQN